MYRSWQHLIIKNEADLRNPQRIRKLLRGSSSLNWFAIIGFAFGGVLSLFLAAFLFYETFAFELNRISMMISSLIMAAIAIMFFIGAKVFAQEMHVNLLRSYLHKPEDFDFIP